MASHASQQPTTEQIVKSLFRRVSEEQVARLVETASSASGQAVGNAGYEPGDDICPVFKFPFPFPPKFDQFLNVATALGAKTRLFPYGIINPEGVLVQVGLGSAEE